MTLFKKQSSSRCFSTLSRGHWVPHAKEKEALALRSHFSNLLRVDHIWEWLANNHGEVKAVDAPHAQHPESFTYSELLELILKAASSFSSYGIEEDDVVALFGENSPRWLVADQGIMRAGAANAVRGANAPIQELKYILKDSKATALVIQNSQLWEKLDLSQEELDPLKVIVQLEGEAANDLVGWDEFLSCSVKESKLNQFGSKKHCSSSIATILYTSGTTGKPKGVPLSHANLVHQIKSLACVANPTVGANVLSVLPIWHSYERSAEYYFFSCACTQSYTTIKYFKDDLVRVQPLVMATVPRLWEAINEGFESALSKKSSFFRILIKMAISNSQEYKHAIRKARSLMWAKVNIKMRLLATFEIIIRFPFHFVASTLFWPKILKQLTGGKLLFPINGGGAIAPYVDKFFEALGVEMLVGYGLTETSPVVCCRRPWRNVRGTSGLPLPDTEFKIVDIETREIKSCLEKGIVLVRGPQVMNGYLGNPLASQKVLDSQGWFDTGDLGMLLEDGSLVITGRSKDTIVLSSGENVEPGPLEELLLSCPLFDQVMLVGQDEKQLGLLIVPNEKQINLWAKSSDIEFQDDCFSDSPNSKLRDLIKKKVNLLLSKRTGFRTEERVVGVAFVEPFTIENGLLTQTLKQRRNEISVRDSKFIDLIYGK